MYMCMCMCMYVRGTCACTDAFGGGAAPGLGLAWVAAQTKGVGLG
jgi:hypothetical protein